MGTPHIYVESDERKCKQCEEVKPIGEFPPYRADGKNQWTVCYSCQAFNKKKWREENPERFRKTHRNGYHRNRDKAIQRNRDRKRMVIEAYGGKCFCCGEHRLEFLTIEHCNGDGAAWRKEKGHGASTYAYLIKHDYPKDMGLAVLCMNCNSSKGLYGYCPHERERHGAVA